MSLLVLQVRWRAELPPPLQGRKANQGSSSSSCRADLVVASYVLGEVASPQQRAELVRHLWSELGWGRAGCWLRVVADCERAACCYWLLLK